MVMRPSFSIRSTMQRTIKEPMSLLNHGRLRIQCFMFVGKGRGMVRLV